MLFAAMRERHSSGLNPSADGSRRTLWVCCSAGAAVALFVWWLSVGYGSAFERMALSDVVFVVAPSMAAVSCLSASRRDAHWRAGWLWLAAGCLVWASASTVWAFYELVLGVVGPFPSIADIGYVGYTIPVAIGLIRFPRAAGNVWSRLRVSLDAGVIGLALLFASAVWVLHPVLSVTGLGTFTRLDALAYPLADVAIAAVMLTRCTMFSGARRVGWMTLGAGWLVLAATDSRYVALTVNGGYQPGHLLDAGWMISFVLIAVAAQIPAPAWQPARTATGGEPPGMTQQLLPYAPVLLAGWAAAGHTSRLAVHGATFWLLCMVGVAVAVRQFVVVADHVALTRDLERIVDRRTAEVVKEQRWWAELVRNVSDVIIVVDPTGRVVYFSPSVRLTLGREPTARWTTADLRAQVHPDDLAGMRHVLAPVLAGTKRSGLVTCRVKGRHNTWNWFEISAVGQLVDAVLEGVVLTLHDVTERQQLTERLSHQAFHDSLTDLPNRALLMQRVEHTLQQPDRQLSALVLIDLDDFKLINDSHGHAAGDLVLVTIGKRLQQSVRSTDTVSRLGGDEFAVLLTGTRRSIMTTARRLAKKIEQPVVAEGRRFLVRSSLGVIFATDDETAQLLLSHADIALYKAKAHHKGGIVVIDGADRQDAADQVRLREQITQPKLDEFHVVYQPIVDVDTCHMRGVEALLRWRHPDLGEIPPAQFIPLAEHGGSISVLGWHVLEVSCRQLAEWTTIAPHHRLAIGVNVSILQLDQPDFARRVVDVINKYGLDTSQIVIELTEQSLSRDFETAVAVVAELRQSGVSVAVDDFGTGYSSLQYLHRFDADVVKIDRSFIANLQDSEHTRKLVRSVIQMAESLDLQCIAEGIETVAQLNIVRALGFELAQGYLFSRPSDPAGITDLLLNKTELGWTHQSSESVAVTSAHSGLVTHSA